MFSQAQFNGRILNMTYLDVDTRKMKQVENINLIEKRHFIF